MLGADPSSAQTGATASDGWVVLPVSEYTALKRAASPAEPEPVAPPVEATLSRIDYDLKVDGDLATGEARLTVDVIKNGWVRVAMPDGLMVRDAQLDGRPVNLVMNTTDKGPGRADLLLSKTGRSVLTLKIVAPVTTVAGTDILHLPVSNSAVSHATVELTRQGVDVRITGGLLLEHSEAATGSRWVANGRGGEPLTFAWRRRVDDARANQPLRLRGSITQLVGLGEDATQINAEVQVEVMQGLADEVRVQLPEQLTVNQVSGAMVADWDVANNELKVLFIEPVQNTARFTLNGELRMPRAGQVGHSTHSTSERRTRNWRRWCRSAWRRRNKRAPAKRNGRCRSRRVGPTHLQPAIAFAHRVQTSTRRWKIYKNSLARTLLVTRRKQCSPQTSKKQSTRR